MHSVVAMRNGIKIRGIRLLIFGGVSQITQEPRTPGIEFKMALAGPLSSIGLGAAFIGIFFLGRRLGLGPFVGVSAFYLGYINVLLGVFNLLPGFPLDGGRVLRSAIWYFTGNLLRATRIASGFGRGIAYFMVVVGVLGPFLGNLSLVWFVLLGLYLLRAAEAEYQEVIFHEALRGVTVGEVMTGNPETVGPDMNIEELVEAHFLKRNYVAFPVVRDGDVLGMVTLKSVQALPRANWKNTRVADIMRPLSGDIATDPDVEVFDVLSTLITKADGRMLVIKDNRLAGILTATDVRRATVRRLHFIEEESGRPAA